MNIKCPQCDTHYDVSDEIANSGAQVQCAKCADIFTASPVSEQEPAPEIAAEIAAEIALEPETVLEDDFDNDISFDTMDEAEPAPKNEDAPEDANEPAFDGDIAFEGDEKSEPEPEPSSNGEPASDLLTDEEKDFFTSFGNKLAEREESEEQSPPVAEPVEAPAAGDEGIDIGWDETQDQDEADKSSNDEELFANADVQADIGPEPAAEAEPEAEKKSPREPAVEQLNEPATSRFPTPLLMGWGALAASLLLMVIAATFLRVPIVKAVPGMAGLYEKAGYPVNIRGLEFYGLSHQWVNERGRMRLIVRGEIVNITDEAVSVPEIVFAMLDASGLEFFQWTERTKTGQLAPLARTRFRAGIPAPVDRVRQLKIRFAKR